MSDNWFGDTDPLDMVDASWDPDGPHAAAALWMDNLANALRYVGLAVVEVEGWQRRSRSSNSGYSRVPTHVVVHHTASATSAENDVNYMTFNADAKPIANLYIERNGVVHVMAGGPTNTNGSGEDKWGGGVPDDSMNSYAVGIEIGNDGIGEYYPEAQVDAARLASAVLLVALNEPIGHLRSHFEWTDRKVDPSGPPLDTPETPGIEWDMDQFRGDVYALITGGDLPEPPPIPPPPVDPPADGYHPPTNWGLFPLDMNKPTIRRGDVDVQGKVLYLQDVIFFYAGGNITRDGDFGPQTEGRVKDVQRFFGFPAGYIDGICGWDGGDGNNPGQYATWSIIDFLVEYNNQPDPPTTPPPLTGVNPTPDAIYYVRSGDSPWGAGERIWGDGQRGVDELPASMFAEPDVMVLVPAVPGVWTRVQAGDSPWSLTATMGGDPATDLDRFYDFNGPETRVLQPGEPVFLPDDR